MTKLQTLLQYFDGNTLLDLFTAYKQQKLSGHYHDSLSGQQFDQSMMFVDWLQAQHNADCYAEQYDL